MQVLRRDLAIESICPETQYGIIYMGCYEPDGCCTCDTARRALKKKHTTRHLQRKRRGLKGFEGEGLTNQISRRCPGRNSIRRRLASSRPCRHPAAPAASAAPAAMESLNPSSPLDVKFKFCFSNFVCCLLPHVGPFFCFQIWVRCKRENCRRVLRILSVVCAIPCFFIPSTFSRSLIVLTPTTGAICGHTQKFRHVTPPLNTPGKR